MTIRDRLLAEGIPWNQYRDQEHKVSANALGRRAKRIKGDITNKGKLEKEIEKEIIRFLLSFKWPVWKMKIKGEVQSTGNGRSVLKKSENSGFPDILVCATRPNSSLGLFVGIEVKKPGGLQSADQQNQEDYIRTGKGIYLIATSVEEVRLALRNLGLCT